MSNRLIQQPGPSPIDWLVFNTGAAVARGESVKFTTAETIKLSDYPHFTGERGPLEGAENATIFPVTKATGATDKIAGIAQSNIGANEWGYIRHFGYGVAKVAETADKATLSGYQQSATAGQLEDGGAGSEFIAIQVGASGTTTSGDLRSVFIDCGAATRAFSAGGVVTDEESIFGDITTNP